MYERRDVGRALAVFFLMQIAGLLFGVNVREEAVITNLHGDIFTIRNGNNSRSYNIASLGTGGVKIKKDDIVQTDEDNILNIKIPEDDAEIILAENSAVLFGGTLCKIDLIYGRIRVKESSAMTINIKSAGAIIQISGADVNIDYTLSQNITAGKPFLCVTPIYGEAVIIPNASDPKSGRIRIKSGESFYVDSFMNSTNRIVTDLNVLKYWETYENNIRNVSMRSLLKTQGSKIIVSDTVTLEPFDFKQNSINLKTGGIIAGLALILSGVIIQTAVHYSGDRINSRTSNLVYGLSYIPIGVGSFSLIASYFYKTPVPDSRGTVQQ